jgi:propionyl-CoA carboxylase alpha chain
VRTRRQHELAQHMIVKPPKDTSKFLMSPMPGQLDTMLVSVGDEVCARCCVCVSVLCVCVDAATDVRAQLPVQVEMGQEVCIVNAMKMRNVLRSPKHGKVRAVSMHPVAGVGAARQCGAVVLLLCADQEDPQGPQRSAEGR